uniref:PUM-HD domain-containing protein n=1 Tax=Angiostrongylus cantonensis TaxID=6313 RepID=A0A158PBP8_ANGCA
MVVDLNEQCNVAHEDQGGMTNLDTGENTPTAVGFVALPHDAADTAASRARRLTRRGRKAPLPLAHARQGRRRAAVDDRNWQLPCAEHGRTATLWGAVRSVRRRRRRRSFVTVRGPTLLVTCHSLSPHTVRDSGPGCRTAYVSPLFCAEASHLSDSGISVSNSVSNSSAEGSPYSPPGSTRTEGTPGNAGLRRPLRHLDSNTQSYTPLHVSRHFEAKLSISPNVASPVPTLGIMYSYEVDNSFGENHTRYPLPSWAVDGQGCIIVPLRKILEEGLLEVFAKDKTGCTFLQANFPEEGTADRELLVKELFEGTNLFECLPEDLKSLLMLELHNCDLVTLCVDQNANHVVQKIMTSFTLSHWQFVVEYFVSNREELFSVAEDKYGCRVIQLAIELLSDTNKANKCRSPLLEKLMDHVVSNCERLASNEFANYVIQHVIKAGTLSDYRDKLIEECLLRNLLSLSQEKYASHVVEKAFEFAPPVLLAEMMDEIFDGYIPHPETKKDALDIMLFHQYGNYVVQRMLGICCEAIRARSNGINLPDMEQRLGWLNRLESRIVHNRHRLARYSSGKKILNALQQLNECAVPTTPSRYRRSCVQTSVPSKYR